MTPNRGFAPRFPCLRDPFISLGGQARKRVITFVTRKHLLEQSRKRGIEIIPHERDRGKSQEDVIAEDSKSCQRQRFTNSKPECIRITFSGTYQISFCVLPCVTADSIPSVPDSLSFSLSPRFLAQHGISLRFWVASSCEGISCLRTI